MIDKILQKQQKNTRISKKLQNRIEKAVKQTGGSPKLRKTMDTFFISSNISTTNNERVNPNSSIASNFLPDESKTSALAVQWKQSQITNKPETISSIDSITCNKVITPSPYPRESVGIITSDKHRNQPHQIVGLSQRNVHLTQRSDALKLLHVASDSSRPRASSNLKTSSNKTTKMVSSHKLPEEKLR